MSTNSQKLKWVRLKCSEGNFMYQLHDPLNNVWTTVWKNEKFWNTYEAKALKNINSSKRDKAETPEAKAKAEADIEKIKKGLKYANELFNK